uniref:Uncharacterized protein n=1 Tax=viral metagenome TaxID=1070528 RepID=A0A6M3KWW6_9ZZZZ
MDKCSMGEAIAELRTKWESLKRDYAVLLQSHEWQQGVLAEKETKMARLRETHAIEVERLSNTCDAYKSRILANGDRLEMVYHEVRELRAENEKLQKTLEMAESQLVRDIASEAFNDACKNLAQAKAENEVLRKRFGDCARCYDTQQGIEDILVNQIIDLRTENILVDQIVALRAENEELRLALVKYKEAQAEIEACQELEAKKQGDEPKDTVL